MSDQIAAIILGAGKGTRMKSDLPKVMMPLAGKPMIRHPIDTLEQMGVKKIVVVTAPDGEMVRREVAPAFELYSGKTARHRACRPFRQRADERF